NIKLATYASRCIENEILMYLRKNSNSKTEVSIDEPLNVDWDGNELLLSDILGTEPDIVYRDMDQADDALILRKIIEDLPPRERDIIKLRYGIDCPREFTQKEVAEKLDISQSYISRLEKKILKKIKKEMQKVT
ncbi:MAG: sigma-70 family RNA polymerase sigma factor, partial [Lachnospiraceae bacterium]|nr:sigma-70 family RNA polymerase sigma factor [Lachnospiraceae bacterium]